MKTILVPTDFSAHAGFAVQTAIKLATLSGASIRVIHILNTPRDLRWNELEENEKANYPETCKKIDEAEFKLQKIKNDYSNDVELIGKVVFDLTFYDLDNYAKEHNVGLIVLGSHGSSGYKELFIGSNAQKVIRVCKTPVLTVKNFDPDVNFDSILYVSSFIKESETAFPKVASISEELGAKLKLLYINKPNNFETSPSVLKRMKRIAGLYPGDYDFTIYNEFTDEEGILAYADSIDVDIISIATHGKRGIRSMFSSLTERLVNHSNKPVLSLSLYD